MSPDRFVRTIPGPFAFIALAVIVSVSGNMGTARAATYVIPHLIEQSGTITNTAFTFDSVLFATYAPGLGGLPPGAGATLDLYLYDNTGAFMKSGTLQNVCAPCSFALGATRKLTITVDTLIMAAGGYGAETVKLGFAVVNVGGADPSGVGLEATTWNSHTNGFDVTIYSPGPDLLPASLPDGIPTNFVVNHVVERQGTIANTQFTIDTSFYAAYTAGLAGIPSGPGAFLNLYLFDNAGAPMKSATNQNVCAPCSFALSAAARKRSILVEDLIVAAGGFGPQTVKVGFAVLGLSGDAGHVNLDCVLANSHTSPFDLAIFDWTVQPIPGAGAVTVPGMEEDAAAQSLSFTAYPNPSRAGLRFEFVLDREESVDLVIYDVDGRRVSELGVGTRAAGVQTVEWDGNDSSGKKIAPGVYFARLTLTSGTMVSRVVLLR
jgi:hypothetical protein